MCLTLTLQLHFQQRQEDLIERVAFLRRERLNAACAREPDAGEDCEGEGSAEWTVGGRSAAGRRGNVLAEVHVAVDRLQSLHASFR
jgi:hypothetical protein